MKTEKRAWAIFGTFLEKLKATWPDLIKQGKTGSGNVAGIDYEWIQGPGATDKNLCRANPGLDRQPRGERLRLQDWIERFHKKIDHLEPGR